MVSGKAALNGGCLYVSLFLGLLDQAVKKLRSNYTESELQGFKKNCPDYAEADPGGEFHAAVAVAMACEVRDAKATFTAMSRDDLRVWIDRLESEIKV